jgi:hypothetical protein
VRCYLWLLAWVSLVLVAAWVEAGAALYRNFAAWLQELLT